MLRKVLLPVAAIVVIGLAAFWFLTSPATVSADSLGPHTPNLANGKTMFDILPADLKSLAVRSKVRYAPHPYVWMAPSHALSTGLGIASEGLELPYSELPAWEESKIQTLPIVSYQFAIRICHWTSNTDLILCSFGRTP